MVTRRPAAAAQTRVVVLIQENKTTDFYFPSLSVSWGAFPGAGAYPVKFYKELSAPAAKQASA